MDDKLFWGAAAVLLFLAYNRNQERAAAERAAALQAGQSAGQQQTIQQGLGLLQDLVGTATGFLNSPAGQSTVTGVTSAAMAFV